MSNDLIRLDADEDTDNPGFDVRCKKCGSHNVTVDDDRAFFDSCATGSLDLVCLDCDNRKVLDAPDI